MINRKFFFDYIRKNVFKGSLSQGQVDGLTSILNFWETNHCEKDDRWLAYILATSYHETAHTMRAVEEYGKGKGKPYGKPDPKTKKIYYGRGHVQLTWKGNYEKMGKILKIDLVNHPELALDSSISVQILFHGMINGSFTGKKLSNYFTATKEDWINARRIVNILDKASLIAGYAKKFYAAISYM